MHTIEKEWTTKSGLTARVVLMCLRPNIPSHRCGYVLTNQTTNRNREEYESLSAHGGITFFDPFGHIDGVDNRYWVGFDCAHYNDGSLDPAHLHPHLPARSLAYCIDQCEALADQVAILQPTPAPTLRGPTRITLEWLKEQGACTSSVNRFALEYPDGVDLTPDNIRRNVAEFDLYWLAFKILPPHLFAAVQRTTRSTIEQCSSMIDAAGRAREKAIGPTSDTRTVGIAWAAFEQAKEAANKEYQRAVGDAFIAALALCTPQEPPHALQPTLPPNP